MPSLFSPLFRFCASLRHASLRREITGILLFKIAVIILASYTVFNAAHRVRIDTPRMETQLFTSAASSQNR